MQDFDARGQPTGGDVRADEIQATPADLTHPCALRIGHRRDLGSGRVSHELHTETDADVRPVLGDTMT
jgi:hypothetical protein